MGHSRKHPAGQNPQRRPTAKPRVSTGGVEMEPALSRASKGELAMGSGHSSHLPALRANCFLRLECAIGQHQLRQPGPGRRGPQCGEVEVPLPWARGRREEAQAPGE